jgi:hypothetical protein
MTEINSLYLTILIELLAFFVVVCLGIVIVAMVRARRERLAIHKVVALIKEDSPRRKEETKNLLEKRFGYQADALQKTTNAITKKELLFYQTLINLFIKRDSKAMEELNIVFEDTVAPYRELERLKSVAQEVPQEEAAPQVSAVSQPDMDEQQQDQAEEIKRLRAKNQQLLEELKMTMKTLGSMLSQYSNMFGDDATAGVEAMAKMIEEEAEAKAEGSDTATTVEDDGQQAAEQESVAGGEDAESQGGDEPIQNVVDDLEPNWDEALAEQLEVGETETSAEEEEPSWDEALAEQADTEESSATGPDDDSEPNWDELDDDSEPNWDDALSEQREEEKKEG